MMKKAVLLVIAWLLSAPVFGESLRNIPYQGQLADASGTILPDAVYTVTLRLYDQENAKDSQAVWKDTYSVQSQNGYFQVVLGTSPSSPLKLASDKPYWIGISAGSDSELKPRRLLNAGSTPSPAIAAGAKDTESAANGTPLAQVKGIVVPEIRYGNNSVNVNTPKITYGKDQTEAGNKRVVFPPNYFNKPPIVLCTAVNNSDALLITVANEATNYVDIKTAVWDGNKYTPGGYVEFNWMAIGW